MKKILILSILTIMLILSGCDKSVDTSDKSGETTTQEKNSSNEDKIDTEEHNWIENYKNPDLSYVGLWTSTIDNGFEITKNSAEFINSNKSLFPTSNKEDLSSVIDETITYKHINKSSDKYTDKMIKVKGQIVEIIELDVENAGYVTEIYMYDENMQGYHILYLEELKDIFTEDNISVIGTPLGLSGFDNVEGGFTNTIVMLGSYIEKTQ